MDKYDYKGVVHLHSTYSDGYGSVEEIMKAANDVGIDFVVLTDHDTLKPAQEGHEKWHDSSLLIVGTEITPPENHYIAFGEAAIENIEELKTRTTPEYIKALADKGWVGFCAHPDFVGTKKFGIGSYCWTDWETDGFTGLGVWNLLDDWLRQIDQQESKIEIYENFPKYLKGPTEEIMRRWDSLCRKRKVVGIGEVDNHKMTRKYEDREIVIFPYEIAFKTITNHILLDEPLSRNSAEAKKQVVEAFRNGNLYLSFDWYADPVDFSFTIEDGDYVCYPGEDFELEGAADLCVSLPEDAEIIVYRNGEQIKTEHSFEVVESIEAPGVYRVEVKREGLHWIISNPIYVLKSEEGGE